MFYLLKVDALIATFVFAGAGLVILALLAWQEAKAFAAARLRIYQRVSSLSTQPQFFANSFAISRRFSRFSEGDALYDLDIPLEFEEDDVADYISSNALVAHA